MYLALFTGPPPPAQNWYIVAMVDVDGDIEHIYRGSYNITQIDR